MKKDRILMNIIEIVRLNDEEIRQLSLETLQLKNVYVTSLKLISSLLSTTLPLKNQSIAIKNTLEFLHYAQNSIHENDTVLTLSRDKLNKFFSSQKREKYIQLLKDLEVMTRVPYEDGKFYEIGKKSCRYRFHNSFIDDETCLVIIDKHAEKISIKSEIKVDSKFKNAIKKSTIDKKEALRAEIAHCIKHQKGSYSLRKRLTRLFDIDGDRFIKKGVKVDRIYHSFSNLSKVSRQFMSVEGMKYNEIDIKNCQPMLLCYYLIKNGLEIDDHYIDDTEKGVFYSRFEGISGNFSVKRNGSWSSEYLILIKADEIKPQLYRSIFFNFSESNPANKKFKELYPKTYESIKNLAEEQTMASILQNLEAEIFNDLIPTASKYYYTLFDAIYFTSKADTNMLESKIKQKFNKLGLIPSLSITLN